MKSCPQPCKNRTRWKTGTDGTHIIPSELFSRAGDTLRVSPDLFRNKKAVIQTEFCTFCLHSSYTAKIKRLRANRIKSFCNLSHPLRMTNKS